MRYNKTIILSNGMECCLRNGTESDGQLVVDNFNLTHSETDYLLTYPDENSFNAAQESQFLKEKAESEREIELLAIVDSVIAGTAGIEAIGTQYKVRHRAEFGISVVKKYWGLGIGKALLTSCIECYVRTGWICRVWKKSQRISLPHSRISGSHFYEIGIVMLDKFIPVSKWRLLSTGVTGWSCLAKASMGNGQIFLDVVRLFLLSLHLNRE